MKLTIIVPVYNEHKTIAAVLAKLAGLNLGEWDKEIIVVDDGSTDNSKIKIQKSIHQLADETQNFLLLNHERNLGKGAAVGTALAATTGDYILIQDADLEYEPNDIPLLLTEAGKNPGAAVFGSRNLKPDRRGYPHYILGVAILTWFANLLFHAKLTDVYTCYKLVPENLIKSLVLQSRGFEFEAELTAKLLKQKNQIVETPIRYYPRSFAEGKKIKAADGIKGLWTILKIWYND